MKQLFRCADHYIQSRDWKMLTGLKFCLCSIGILLGVLVPVKQCWVLHINSDYMRKGPIDVKQLFQIEDVTDAVAEAYINTPGNAVHNGN